MNQVSDHDVMLYQEVADLLTRLVAVNTRHCEALQASLSELDGGNSMPRKLTVASLEGSIAGVIDKLRRPKVSKALRSDFTALALCTVTYGEYLTNARAMRNADLADLAQRHIADYVSLQTEISECISDVVVRELADIDPNVDIQSADQSRRDIKDAMRMKG